MSLTLQWYISLPRHSPWWNGILKITMHWSMSWRKSLLRFESITLSLCKCMSARLVFATIAVWFRHPGAYLRYSCRTRARRTSASGYMRSGVPIHCVSTLLCVVDANMSNIWDCLSHCSVFCLCQSRTRIIIKWRVYRYRNFRMSGY